MEIVNHLTHPSRKKYADMLLEKRQAKARQLCLEATGSYGEAVAEFLYERGYRVSVVNLAGSVKKTV